MSDEILTEETISEQEKKEIFDSIKLNPEPVVAKKPGPKAKKDLPTPKETKILTENEAVSVVDDKGKELYDDLRSFLENKSDIVQDDAENKQVIPTGISLLDSILGGGFAIGALNIIVGAPGSGKSMLAMHAMAN